MIVWSLVDRKMSRTLYLETVYVFSMHCVILSLTVTTTLGIQGASIIGSTTVES